MTEPPQEQMFRSRLKQAVDELSRDGWDIVETPGTEALPESLRDWQPDFIARRGSDIIIGEVKSRNSANLEDLNHFAQSVADLANARFEVYWLGDAPESEPPIDNVRVFIREASELTQAGHLTAGTLTAWAALEGAIIHFASDKEDIQAWRSPRQLLSNLYSLGYVSEQDFQRLMNLAKARSEIAHHVSRITPSVGDIEFILKTAERMASGQYVSVDQMIEWFQEHYEIPAMHTPHESAEGGYLYGPNEPRDPHDVLSDEFREATEADILQAAEALVDIAPEWVLKYPDTESR